MNPAAGMDSIAGRKTPWAAVWGLGIALFLLQIASYLAGSVVQPGALVDADGYSRLVRVQHLAETGAWFDPTMPRSNPAVPETIQWSRWIDGMLLVGGWCLAPFFGREGGLFAWAVAFSPFSMALCAPAAAWAGRRLLGPGCGFYAALLLLVQPGVAVYLAAGRPDHHGPLLLLMILGAGCLIRALAMDAQATRWAAAAGLVQAAALTISIEAVVATILGLAITGLAWIWNKKTPPTLPASYATALALGCAAGVATTIAPQAWNFSEIDRLAPAHIWAWTTVAVFWGITRCLPLEDRPLRRVGWAVLGAATCIVATLAVAPDLLKHPQLAAEPRIGELWLRHIQEYHPLATRTGDWPRALMLWMGPSLVAIPWLAQRLLRKEPNTADTLPWLYLLLGATAFALLNTQQIRWCTYTGFFAVLPWTALLVVMLDHWSRRNPSSEVGAAVGRTLLTLAFMAGFPALALLLPQPDARPANAPVPSLEPASTPVDLKMLSTWLNGPDFSPDHPETILAHLDFGPELIYRTRHQVIATPNHRNAEGMLFLYDTLRAPPQEARERLAPRKVSLVILAPASQEADFLLQEKTEGSLYQALVAGQAVPGLEPLDLPDGLSAFRVFRVTGE